MAGLLSISHCYQSLALISLKLQLTEFGFVVGTGSFHSIVNDH